MRTEDDTLLVREELAEAIALLVFDDEATRERHRHTMHLIVDASRTQLLLRLTDSSDLGIGIDDTWDSAVAHHILRAGDVVYSDLPFASSGVSEHRRAIDITDSIDTRY